MLTKTLVVAAIFLSTVAYPQHTLKISGKITDSKTAQPLPYASVGLAHNNQGIISNQHGIFQLIIPDSLRSDTLQINYLGYETFKKPLSEFNHKEALIALEPSVFEINVVVINPLNVEEIIQKVLENYSDNYPNQPFVTNGFYLQEFVENEQYIDFIEAYIDIYNIAYSDTGKCQARVIQGRTRDDLIELQFMKKFAERKQQKNERKAKRKNETPDTVSAGVQIQFAGPESFYSIDLIRNLADFYDKEVQRKMEFHLESSTSFANRELYAIRCITKRPINYAHIDALIFIDKKSFAIVKQQATIRYRIPAFAKPLLAAYKIKLDSLAIFQDVEYKMLNNRWYPNKSIMKINFDATKNYWGNYSEQSVGYIKVAFATTNILTENQLPFSEDKCIGKGGIKNNLGEYNPTFWDAHSKINYQVY